jgi:hypothetical protein
VFETNEYDKEADMSDRGKLMVAVLILGLLAVLCVGTLTSGTDASDSPGEDSSVSAASREAPADGAGQTDEAVLASRFNRPHADNACGDGRCSVREWESDPSESRCPQDCFPDSAQPPETSRERADRVLYTSPTSYVDSGRDDRGQVTFGVPLTVSVRGVRSVRITQLAGSDPDEQPAAVRLCAHNDDGRWCSTPWASFSPHDVFIPEEWQHTEQLVVQWEGATFLTYALNVTLN